MTMDFPRDWAEAVDVMQVVGLDRGITRSIGLRVRRYLFELARSIDAQTALDLGTCKGVSTATLALAVPGRIVTVDVEDANADDARWSHEDSAGRPRGLMKRLDRDGCLKVSHRVEFVTADAHAYLLTRADDEFDLIHLDAGHQEEPTYRQLVEAVRVARRVVLMDDVFPPEAAGERNYLEGPRRALERWTAEHPGARVVDPALDADGRSMYRAEVWP